MKCEKCNFDLVVFDASDRGKPLRCSDACAENRKSLDQRGASPAEPKRGRWGKKADD